MLRPPVCDDKLTTWLLEGPIPLFIASWDTSSSPNFVFTTDVWTLLWNNNDGVYII